MAQDGSLDQRFAEAMGQLLGPDFPSEIGLAVSGGGDSMAMLYLAHNWTRVWGVKLWVVTVDHGLRAESADEAAMVARECAVLGWSHATVRWRWDRQGNVQDAARQARLTLIDRWRGEVSHVLMAHTQDDLAETFLMRLARGSGVDGLSAMQATRDVDLPGPIAQLSESEFEGVLPPQRQVHNGMYAQQGRYHVLRPCLAMQRSELRHYLRTLQGPWVEDPSNDDPRFERVKIRALLPKLAEIGLDVPGLARTGQRMARAREGLSHRAWHVFEDINRSSCHRSAAESAGEACSGAIVFDRDGFEQVERETQMRLLAAALQYVSGATYRPRAAPLDAVLDRLLGGGAGTLHGCEIRTGRDTVNVFREYQAVRDLVVGHANDVLWDGRWRVFARSFQDMQGVEIRALGEDGWTQVTQKPALAPSYAVARSLPALWQGDSLLACDAMGVGPGSTTELWPMGRASGRFKDLMV